MVHTAYKISAFCPVSLFNGWDVMFWCFCDSACCKVCRFQVWLQHRWINYTCTFRRHWAYLPTLFLYLKSALFRPGLECGWDSSAEYVDALFDRFLHFLLIFLVRFKRDSGRRVSPSLDGKPALKTIVISSNLSSVVWRWLASVQMYERVLIIGCIRDLSLQCLHTETLHQG